MKYLLAILMFAVTAHPLTAQAALIKRKVLVLDFVNKNKADKNNGYLVETIPDALMDPLKDTNSFELLPRDKSREVMKTAGFKTDDLANESVALEIAKKSGAHVVVMGSFVVSKREMVFQARALEVHSSRLAVSKSKRGRITANMFDLINALAKEMAQGMKEELPPLPQERIVEIYGQTFTISVLDLETNGVAETLGKAASDKLRESLHRWKLYKLVEQQKVRQALQKAGHTPSQLIDDKAIALGQELQSDKVVLGRISRVGEKIEISTRLVDVKTREVMATASQKITAESELDDACDKIAAKFKDELESTREKNPVLADIGKSRFSFDTTVTGNLALADLAPALSPGLGLMLSPRYALVQRDKWALPLRFTGGALLHFGKSGYGNTLQFLTAPLLFGTGFEWNFSPKLSLEFIASGGAAVSYLKSESLNSTYISTDPALMGLLGVRYNLSSRVFLRTALSYLWVFYSGSDLMSAAFNFGVGVNL